MSKVRQYSAGVSKTQAMANNVYRDINRMIAYERGKFLSFILPLFKNQAEMVRTLNSATTSEAEHISDANASMWMQVYRKMEGDAK